MDKQVAAVRYSQWEQIVLEANRSPLPKRIWCKQNGINEKSFYYWQHKVRKNALAAKASVPAVPDTQHPFVELPMKSSGIRTIHEDVTQEIRPELLLQIGDCRMFITGAIQKHTLATVMKVIRDA